MKHQGGGEVHVRIPAVKSISPIDLTSRGEITKFSCRSFVAGVLPLKIAEEMAAAAEQGMRSQRCHVMVFFLAHYPCIFI